MDQIGIAREPDLTYVVLGGKLVRLPQQLQVFLWPVLLDLPQQLAELGQRQKIGGDSLSKRVGDISHDDTCQREVIAAVAEASSLSRRVQRKNPGRASHSSRVSL